MRKILAVILSIVMILGVLPLIGYAEETPEIPEGYTPIYTKDDLDNIRLNMTGKYILMNDIIFTDADYAPGGDFYNSGKGFVPIGNGGNAFSGTFDGNEHIILNLRINNPNVDYQGLFGYVRQGKIQNLILYNLDVSGRNHVGGVIGYYKTDTTENVINNCDVYGIIKGTGKKIGGICGTMDTWNSSVMNCNNFADVSGDGFVGGICGYDSLNTYILYSVNYGNIHSISGIAAGIASSFYTIINCYNLGAIISDTEKMTYGICSDRNQYNNYSIGIAYYGNNGSHCYYLDESVDESQWTGDGCRSVDQLKKQSNYEFWDFDTIWTIDKNAEYPFPTLRENPKPFEPKLPCNHENTELHNAANATCTEAGYTGDLVCLDCGETVTEGETINPLGHDYVDHPSQAATCIAVGWEAYQTCSRCDYTSYEEKGVDPTNHVNTQTVPETASTCIAHGYTAGVYCNDCKQYISGHTEKALADHTWNSGEVIKEATCKEKGLVKYTCTVPGCGETQTVETDIASNNHNYVSAVTAPTCTAQGYTTYTCSRCGYTYKGDYVAPLGHSYKKTVTAPTCTSEGYTTYTCVRGDHVYSADRTPALKHVDNNGDGVCDYGCGTVLTPSNPSPSSNDKTCAYCGKVHPNNFIGFITSFFHSIAYIFARMFGTR